jgi:quercetin dioxygenase-like cupin family protein
MSNQGGIIVKVRNFREVEPNNEVPGVALRTVISAQDGAPRFAMRVFEVEPGASTPFHAHAWEHEVFILEGEAKVRAVDGERALKPNDAVFVASQEEHCFVNTGPQVLRFICCIPHPETLPSPPR